MLVVLALLLFGLGKILLPSIRKYINRMPKGIFVLLFLAIICAVIYLVHYLFNDEPGGLSGNEKQDAASAQAEEDTPQVIKENCVVLSGSEVYIENEKADMAKLEKYIDYRVENNIPVTIVDDYATLALMSEIKAVCEKKGARYSVENEEWLK